MNRGFVSRYRASICFLAISACTSGPERRFEVLNPHATGIGFVNALNPTPQLNIFNYLYYYDGGGVAAGDLNGDGLPDLYFTSNEGRNRLYVNRGDFRFEDVTDRGGAFDAQPGFWSTGVVLVDINGDSLLDIYVSNVGGYPPFAGHNQLFINQGSDRQGIPRFEERAVAYGLDLVGLSTQAAFVDCDQDGDLDLYMMNHSVHAFGTFTDTTLRRTRHALAGDRLFRNTNGKFTEITDQAGIYSSALGYGLGIGIADLNQDGRADIYVGNDFHEDDYLYLNKGDCTFTESLGRMIHHTSYSSMGNDLVDIDNDGLIDIISLDMLPEEYEDSKTSVIDDPPEIADLKRSYGYKPQVSRNTLQLNRGKGKFSEIGLLAGVHATDWSWAALGADFDNDGHTDIFITNGIYRRTNDLDYTHFISQTDIQRRLRGPLTAADLKLADRAPSVSKPDYMYRNRGTLFFEDVSQQWGFDQPTFANGAAYVDLDNDGDLDLVTNNVNQPASVYRNLTREKFPHASNYLKVRFNGPPGNTSGIGTRITIPRDKNHVIVRELYPVRGFQSSVEPVLHAGLDSLAVIPELRVRWPNGKEQTLRNIRTGQTLTIDYRNAGDPAKEKPATAAVARFEDITGRLGVAYKHQENSFNEFNREALMPHTVSREGPALAVGDVNADGLEDFFVGGAKRQPGSLFIQQQNRTFKEKKVAAFQEDFVYEDVDAQLVDFTGDGNLDLLVVSGGNEYSHLSVYMLPRLYVNDGAGNFSKDSGRLPAIRLTGSVAAVGDVDGNGLPDIFLGARAVPWSYGTKPTSYLLINRGDGHFETDTTGFGKQFSDLGLVTGAQWADMNGDGRLDLVVASEWSNLKIVYNSGERPVEIPGSSGLWNTLTLADLDHNGRPDVLAGNLGLNSKFKASNTAPLRMYVNDFDGNGTIEQLITWIDRDGRERLFATKDELGTQLPAMHQRFETYRAFAEAGLNDVVDTKLLDRAVQYSIDELRSAVFYNQPDGFSKVALPVTSQFSPIRDFLVTDLNGDGFPDLLSAGNRFDANVQRGRYDADYGNVLINDGNGKLQPLPNQDIDWYLEGQIRRIALIRIGEMPVVIVAENDGPVRFFRINGPIVTSSAAMPH
jgi:enediyne biosynthesis protein E4